MKNEKRKIIITAAANNFHFIKYLVPALSEDFNIEAISMPGSNNSRIELDKIASADLLWMEWADGVNIAFLAGFDLPKTILRIHRYEVFQQRVIQDLNKLNIEAIKKINKLVFVSKKVKEIGTMHFPWMCEGVVIPNLIDTDKFPFTDRQKGYNILMLGRMSYVKNLPLALTMFHEILKLDHRYQLHIVGEISDPELTYYAANFMDKAGINDNMHFHGRIDNNKLPEFMKDMHYILCSSIFESQGLGILEAMCCGLKPIIFDFPGAENIFPDKWRWIDRSEFMHRIMTPDYHPIEYHQFVVNEFSIDNQIHLYQNLITETLDLPYRAMGAVEIMCCVAPPFNDGLHCAGISKEHHDKHCKKCTSEKKDSQTAGYMKAIKGDHLK